MQIERYLQNHACLANIGTSGCRCLRAALGVENIDAVLSGL
jgi:hypothetical protein